MSILSRRVGGPLNAGEVFAGCSGVSIGSASRRATGGARRVGVVAMAVLAAMALGADPDANAGPALGCPQGPPPGPGPGCGRRAFLADIAAAGFRNSNGNQVALDEGLDYLWPDGRWPQSTEHGEPVLGGQPGARSRRGGAGRPNRYPRPVPVAPLGS
jgi:hypothetical protein